ncbi:hypothetical protein Mpt1_c10010 [Candidatus Methanoplasma termitum]|uniref:DUF1016 domain-containing protein n=1 Tax=Candidatus Methanoplasma termitum TaxID=1577791 RepID=A0A0A7LCS7_9ARCH|nr:PDDEXK nuclease domain-containing protein [Candidatus Methanoplasma termitum]AIZ56874.1 hypothetical protein Mpt1_c10010 [Candidatus Methanoplasma termitum]MCL2333511.1 PDDEXK nuclease domain-containing protein [Candidatus Methanoplasma sp.]
MAKIIRDKDEPQIAANVPEEIIEENLFKEVREILNSSRGRAYAALNSFMVEAYWKIGRLIVEKQGGAERAAYGDGLIKSLSKQLTAEYGRGFDDRNLRYMRQFYSTLPNWNAVRSELSWTHYRLILRVENPRARNYYLEECANGNWSTRQLERQINSFCYERVLASRNKEEIRDEIIKKEPGRTAEDIIKDPSVLEFAGLDHNSGFRESTLEKALITHMQKFLLELGNGFTFEARQKRISLDGRHFYIDLVFYNYRLKCFVLIDLKTGELTHQDIGQMQMYVNYYTRELMEEGDNKPIGIILCASKSDTIVRYTLPEDNTQVFASKYKMYIPSEEELCMEIESERRLFERERFLNEESGEGGDEP